MADQSPVFGTDTGKIKAVSQAVQSGLKEGLDIARIPGKLAKGEMSLEDVTLDDLMAFSGLIASGGLGAPAGGGVLRSGLGRPPKGRLAQLSSDLPPSERFPGGVKVPNTDTMIGNFSSIDVVFNPSKADIMRMLKDSRNSLRWIRDPDTNDLVVWDAKEAIHPTIASRFKLPAAGSNIGHLGTRLDGEGIRVFRGDGSTQIVTGKQDH